KATPQLVDLVELTRTVLTDLKLQLDEKGHRLTLKTSGDALAVFADPQLLRQVMLNFTSNAIKYSPRHSDIRVALTGEQDVVRWQIKDTGIGIPKESQRHYSRSSTAPTTSPRSRPTGRASASTWCG